MTVPVANLSVLVPKTIDDTNLTSSTVAEPSGDDPAAYNAGTTYDVGDFVYTTDHLIYRSRVSSNTGNTPATSPTQWAYVRPTNKYAMFDGLVSTATVATTSLTIVIEAGFFNAIYIGGVAATTVNITQLDMPSGTEVYSSSNSLRLRTAPATYEWLFGEFVTTNDLLITGLTPRSGNELTIEFLGDNISVGIVALGNLKRLGTTQYGATATPNDFSYVRTNEFGETTVVRRSAANDLRLTAFFDVAEAGLVHQTLMDLRGTPAVWVGATGAEYQGLRSFGLGRGEINFDNVVNCQLTVNVKGFI